MALIMVIWVLVRGHTYKRVSVECSTWALIFSEAVLASLLRHVAYFYAIKSGMLSRVIPVASAFPPRRPIGWYGLLLGEDELG